MSVLWTAFWTVCAFSAGDIPDNTANPEAARQVAAGARAEANAAWWGFDPLDATACLQGAIDSGARKVVVPYVGTEWIVRPITLRSNLELRFDPGVVVLAKKGEFKGKGDSLFRAADASDITLRGYGAMLRMRKADYQSNEYEKGEWRMALDLAGCRRIRVEGLRLESSGGDGIYLGSTANQPYCEDIVIRDVVCHDNHRQGISVISAVNLLIENCVLSATSGTAPQAGIDFEPNRENEKLVNCVLRNCRMEDNHGAGILVYLRPLSGKSEPVSISFEDCYVRGGKDTGIGIGAIKDDGPRGLVQFTNCTIEGAEKGGLYLYDKSVDAARVVFVNCKWQNVGMKARTEAPLAGGPYAPLLLSQRKPNITNKLGGIEFVDCHVYDNLDRPALIVEGKEAASRIYDLKGNISVSNPHGARVKLPHHDSSTDLRVTEVR